MKYACREFTKGGADDEERLMRRIMIARRNNLKDHAVIKKMRAAEADSRGIDVTELKKRKLYRKQMMSMEEQEEGLGLQLPPLPPSNPSGTKPRRIAGTIQPSDQEVLEEMDVPAVEATRSYKKWQELPDGEKFVYNQTYEKGKKDHDWLLRKNIWRRMRYRRENKAKVERMRIALGENDDTTAEAPTLPQVNLKSTEGSTSPQEEAKMGDTTETGEGEDDYVAAAAAAAAVAVADSLAPPDIDADAVAALVPDPQALDAAAQLAATIQDDEPDKTETVMI